MRTFIFLCCSIVFSLTPNNIVSQNSKIKVKEDKILTVDEVFKLIMNQTDYKFFYEKDIFKDFPKVSVKKGVTSTNKLLKKSLSHGNLDIAVTDNKGILIKEKPNVSITEKEQQRNSISGTIYDGYGVPVIGATIVVKGTQRGTTTDFDGAFTIEVEPKDILLISYLGMESKEVSVNGKSSIHIELKESTEALDDVTIVAYAKQKKESVVASITTINPSELKVPSSNLTTALAGRVAGIISYQRSGEPGQNNADFFIRGITSFGLNTSPLILIDGVETTSDDLARLTPDDIQSFSIMKDATATSLYGARGANGVVLVTTKEGKEGKINVSVRYENSFSGNTRNVEVVDPITYMRLANEAVLTRNPLGILPYSQSKIDNTVAGLNPFAFPANDWMSDLVSDFATNRRLNLNISGGGKIARYYISGSVNKDTGILNVDKRNNFNNNVDFRTYQLRSNINIDLTKTTEAVVRLAGTFSDYNGPIDGGSGIFRKILASNPVLFPAFYPSELRPFTKHILFGNAPGTGTFAPNFINPYADLVKGYRDNTNSTMSAQFELKQDFSSFLPGFSARMLFNLERRAAFGTERFYNPFFYSAFGYDKQDNTYQINALNEATGTDFLGFRSLVNTIIATSYTEIALNYNQIFKEKHEVTGLLVGIRRNQLLSNQETLEKSLPYRNQGISGRLTYGYDSRYLAEFNFGYNGSERFHVSNRYGFFPSVGFGWIASNEEFWKGIENTITSLKFKASYGLVGNDAIGDADDRFFYLSRLNINDFNRAYSFGSNYGNFAPGISIAQYPNENITWETSRKLNVGFEMSLLNSIDIQAEYFTERRDNILTDRAFIPSTLGLTAPVRANLGQAQSNGIDFSIDFNKSLNDDLWVQGRANFTYSQSKIKFIEEPEYRESNAHLSRIGHRLGQQQGLIAERLFIDQEDVDNSPRQNYGEYAAGDIKFRDVNGDGEITNLDIVPIGHPVTPEIIYGGGLSFVYKAVDFSFFLQGSARSSFWIDSVATAPFITNAEFGAGSENALLQVYADNHWSEQNRDSYALWPRLSSTLNRNNSQQSTWFMRDGAFLRLKSAEFGFTFSEQVTNRLNIKDLRIYLSGTNLLTFSKFKLWDIEMGGNGLNYPIQRVFNLGVTVKL